LSLILEDAGSVPPPYFLSRKSCEAILQRGTRQGKELPPLLAAALRKQSGS
jgi:hypothetical protein